MEKGQNPVILRSKLTYNACHFLEYKLPQLLSIQTVLIAGGHAPYCPAIMCPVLNPGGKSPQGSGLISRPSDDFVQ
jgi:predicted RNA methylase